MRKRRLYNWRELIVFGGLVAVMMALVMVGAMVQPNFGPGGRFAAVGDAVRGWDKASLQWIGVGWLILVPLVLVALMPSARRSPGGLARVTGALALVLLAYALVGIAMGVLIVAFGAGGVAAERGGIQDWNIERHESVDRVDLVAGAGVVGDEFLAGAGATRGGVKSGRSDDDEGFGGGLSRDVGHHGVFRGVADGNHQEGAFVRGA